MPTPAANRIDRKRTITHDTECPLPGPPETVVSQLTKKVRKTVASVGLGFMIESTPFPMMNSMEPMFEGFPSMPAHMDSSLAEFHLAPLLPRTAADTPALMTANPHGETTIQFNPNGHNQFDVSMNHFTASRKEITMAAIGFPCDFNDSGENTNEEPVFLIAFQSRVKPIIPTPIKQVVLPPTAEDVELQADSNQRDLQY